MELAIDVAIFAVLTSVTQISIWHLHILPGSSTVNSLLSLLGTTALLYRRHFPLIVLVVVLSVLLIQTIAFGSVESAATSLPFIVAIYSIARSDHSPYLIAILSLIAISVQAFRDPNVKHVGDALFTPILTCAVYILGKLVHIQHKRTELATTKVEAIELAQATLVAETISAERARISRELHDVIAHGISVMALQAGAADQVMDADPGAAKRALRIVRETGHDVVREMSRLVSLLGDKAESNLEAAHSLGSIGARVASLKQAGLHLTYSVEGAPRVLSPAVEFAAFRIVQEGLTNVLKHAPTSITKIEIRYLAEGIEIEVVNDSSIRLSQSESGRGLIGIAERVAFLNGRQEMGSHLNGWRLFVFLPESA